ncbi:DUF4395 domain-containing protein [Microbacterium sp. P06]|uniref:DUF4395 domain-containing protein n=1 Tax=Microbacterium sp. P06 TaxID=3366949 RepID=UPI0037466B45
MSDSPSRGIDPRGPRFVASVTALLLAVAVVVSLTGLSTRRSGGADAWALPAASVVRRIADPAFLLLLVIAALFLWGVVSPRTAPWALLFRRVVRPRLSPPRDLEDPRPPRFAQGVGLFVVTVGLVLQLAGVPWALPIAAAMAFAAAFLNAVFGLCLGCQLYLVLQRGGIVGRARPAV